MSLVAAPLATTQSNFRTHLKRYIDAAVADSTPVYITRADDHNAVVSSQHVYNLLTEYANAEPGSTEHALLRYELVEAGIIKDSSSVYSTETLHSYFDEIAAHAAATV